MKNKMILSALTGLFFASTIFANTDKNYIMLGWPAASSAYPIYPVTVYKEKTNGALKQIAYVPDNNQKIFLDQYDSNTSGTYKLYYSSVEGKGALVWHACSIVLANGQVVFSATTCPGVVKPSQQSTGSNVYVLSFGSSNVEWGNPVSAPYPYPKATQYADRKIIFKNNTKYPMIQIGESYCPVFTAPGQQCPNAMKTLNFRQIVRGKSATLTIGDAGLNSAAFFVTGYQKKSGKWIDTGGYGNGENAYATKIELTVQPAITDEKGVKSAVASNLDVSAVDGFNVGVMVYPASHQYCTYTAGAENSGILGAGYFSRGNPLASLISTKQKTLRDLCLQSSQLPSDADPQNAWNLMHFSKSGDFVGCYSPCTYAKANNLDQDTINQFCCPAGSQYGTPGTCLAPVNMSYTGNLHQHSRHLYAFSYDDANGDFGCPGDADFVVEFISEVVPM